MSSPRLRRRDLTSQKILTAARKLLVQKGLSRFSIRTLAARVDYSPAAIYRYYTNKEAILQAIRAEGWELSGQIQNRQVSESLSIAEKLIAAGLAYQEFAITYPEHYLLMFDSPDLPPAGVPGIASDSHFTPLVRLIEAGVKAGEFVLPKGMNPTLMGFMLWTSSHGMAMVRIKFMRNNHVDFDRLCEQVIRNYIYSVAKK